MSRVLHTPVGQRLSGDAITPGQLAIELADLDQRVHALRSLGVRGRARAIAGLARWWLAACETPPPALAERLAAGCDEAGISIEMLRWGVREALGRWTEPSLVALVERELGGLASLDHGDAGALAVAPRLCLQVLARTVPPAGWQSVAMAWLAGAAALIRPSTHLAGLIEAFALSLAEAAPELAAVTWVTRSDADDHDWHRALASHADALVIHGSDDAVAAWQSLARRDALVIAHGHRVSAAFLPVEGLAEPTLSENLRGLALDLCAWDQTGCLSPVTLYVEDGGPLTADQVAQRLVADALPAIEAELPPGTLEPGAIAERTLFVRTRLLEARVYSARTAHLPAHLPAHVIVHADTGPGPLEASCLHRVLLVRPVASVDALVETLRRAAPHLQALAVGGSRALRALLAERLARAGLNRVCAPGHLQRPPLAWSHDGRGCLRPLVRWTDVE
jgi:hypothetical protein